MSYKKAKFVISNTEVSARPKDGRGHLLLLGRSNVGKSTLINALCGQKIAFSSKKAGKTKLLNYFLIEDKFYLVDAPGYGSTDFATKDTIQFSSMVEEYVKCPELKAIALLLDLRIGLSEEDKRFISYLSKVGRPLAIILTKTDKMNQSQKAKAKTSLNAIGIEQYLSSDLSAAASNKICDLFMRLAK